METEQLIINTQKPLKPNHSIILVFDPSFDANYGLEPAIAQIYSVVKQNAYRKEDMHLFFGILERLNWHVLENARVFGWPELNLHPIQKREETDEHRVAEFFGHLIVTNPLKVLVFRDNTVSDIGHLLIDQCIAAQIPVTSYNSLGFIEPVNKVTMTKDQKQYFRDSEVVRPLGIGKEGHAP